MLSAFWNGIGSKLADEWGARLLTPALLFWGAGGTAWVWSQRPPAARGHGLATDLSRAVEHRANVIARLSTSEQVLWLVAALLVVAASAVVAERLTAPFLRMLEGYWPGGRPRWLWRALVGFSRRRRGHLRTRWGQLRERAEPTPADRAREGMLARRLHAMPPEAFAMPTALGNILRAGELRPARRYGLDVVPVWPRLWLVLPDTTRQELIATRAGLDAAGRGVLWAVASVIWSLLVWWAAPVAVAVALVIYRGGVLPAAVTYSDLVEAAFDLHRSALYEALRLPAPPRPADEPEAGQQLSTYLWEGYAPESLHFRDGSEPTSGAQIRS